MAATPEDSSHTSIQRRIHARQEHARARAVCERAAEEPESVDPELLIKARQRLRQGPEHGLWLCSIDRALNRPLLLDDYLELVEQTGRMLVTGKRGVIPAELRPILERLDIDVERWLAVTCGRGSFLGSAVGCLARLVTEATRRGLQWIADKTGIHLERRGRPRAAPA